MYAHPSIVHALARSVVQCHVYSCTHKERGPKTLANETIVLTLCSAVYRSCTLGSCGKISTFSASLRLEQNSLKHLRISSGVFRSSLICWIMRCFSSACWKKLVASWICLNLTAACSLMKVFSGLWPRPGSFRVISWNEMWSCDFFTPLLNCLPTALEILSPLTTAIQNTGEPLHNNKQIQFSSLKNFCPRSTWSSMQYSLTVEECSAKLVCGLHLHSVNSLPTATPVQTILLTSWLKHSWELLQAVLGDSEKTKQSEADRVSQSHM